MQEDKKLCYQAHCSWLYKTFPQITFWMLLLYEYKGIASHYYISEPRLYIEKLTHYQSTNFRLPN